MADKRFIVVGGGAAGFFAAIRAKTLQPSLEVIIVESAPRVLGKVKISGGGRCNVTTSCFEVSRLVQNYPRGQRELIGAFNRFGPQDTVAWFESHGVRLKTEVDGRMFPTTDDSQTIIDCLLREAHKAGLVVYTKTPVHQVTKTDGGFGIEAGEQHWTSDAVLLATGSSRKGLGWAEMMGHKVISPVPSLFTFNIKDKLLHDLAGISFPHVVGRLDCPGTKPIIQEGPLLMTHWGVSGPVILRLSAWGARPLHEANYHARLLIDFIPGTPQEDIRQLLLAQKTLSPRKYIGNECPVDLPKRFWHYLLGLHEISPELIWVDVPQKNLNRLSESLKQCAFNIQGKGVFKDEFVTAGGVSLKEINFKTMESRIVPGLFLAGEIIDVDALTGGFNFQNAWSTGWIAGESASQLL